MLCLSFSYDMFGGVEQQFAILMVETALLCNYLDIFEIAVFILQLY